MKYNTDMNLPEAYCKQMQELLGEEYTAYLAALEQPPMAGLRVNTGKVSVEEFLKISPFSLRPVPWCSEGFYYDRQEKPGTHAYYAAGLYYLQ